MQPTEAPAPGAAAPHVPADKFFVPRGKNERVDLSTAKPDGGDSVMTMSPEGQQVLDREKFAVAVAKMVSETDRIEELLSTGGVAIKRVGRDDNRVVEETVQRTATVEETMERVRRFLAPPGPTFISVPIRGWIYVGHTPTYANILDAEAAARAQSNDPEQFPFFFALSQLIVCMYGRIREDDPHLAIVRAMPTDLARWTPALSFFNPMVERDPTYHLEVVKPLLEAFTEWQADVTPSDDDLKKYSGLVR